MAVPLLRFSFPSLSSKSSSLLSPLLRNQFHPSKPSILLPKQQSLRELSSIVGLKLTASMATHATTSNEAGKRSNSEQQQQQQVPDIEDFVRVHEDAMSRAEGTYIDPETGYTVFTEFTHLKRGKCCGNRCRHCPYGFEKVRPPGGYRKGSWRSKRANSKIDSTIPPPPPPPIPGAPVAKLRSGDTSTAQRMVREILERAGKPIEDETSGRVHRRRAALHLEESDNDDDEDDLSSTSSSSSSSYSSSSCSSIDTKDGNDGNIQNRKPSTITVPIKDAVACSTSSAATTASATTESATTESSSTNNDPNASKAPIPTTATTTTPTKNVPYTRSGDQGTSQLGNGERRSKTDDAFEAMGTVDELCSFVGVAHSHLLNSQKAKNRSKKSHGDLPVRLLDVMSRLFDVGSHVAKPSTGQFVPNGIGDGFDSNHVDDLEEWINEMTQDLPELTSFILPTGAPASAALHVARTVCRRAERRMVPLVVQHKTCDPNALRYLNRLSDFFFVSARWVNYKEGQEEIEYKLDIYDCEDDEDSRNEDQRERVVRSLAEPGEK